MPAVSFRGTAPGTLVVPASLTGDSTAEGQHIETIIERTLVIDP